MNNDFFNEMLSNDNDDGNTFDIGLQECKCSACGSILNSKDKLNKCSFCGSENVISSQCSSDYTNTYIIPFMKNKEDAIKNYKKKVLINPIIPMIFKKKSTISSCSKMYLVSSLCDLHLGGTTTFIGIDKNDKNSQSKHEVVNTVNFDYNNVLVCDNSKIDGSSCLDICECNYSNLKEFDSNYLNDSVILFGDLDEKDICTKVSNLAVKTSLSMIRDNVQHDTKKLGKNGLILDNFKRKRVLIPVYILNVKYDNKNYMYLMNGENGKSLINLTFGKIELAIVSLLIFGLIFLIAFLVAYFL